MILKQFQIILVVCMLFRTYPSNAAGFHVQVGVLYNPLHDERLRALEVIAEKQERRITLQEYKVMSDRQQLLSRDVPDKFKDADCLFDLGTNNDQVYALSSMIGIPLIKVTSIISYVPYNLTLSMMPSPKTIAEALFKLTMYFGFEDVAIAYDARQGRLADWFQSISAMKDFYKISMMPELNLKNKNETREALKVLLATRIKNVVLICASNDLAEIMNETLFVGINDDEYKWIASDADTWGSDKVYPSIWGMTGLRMHLANEREAINLEQDDKTPKRSTSPAIYASIQDAVDLLVSAIESLIKNKEWPSSRKSRREMGNKLFTSIKRTRFAGLTGTVAFDSVTGDRLVESGLDFMNIENDDIKKIGTVNMSSARNEFTRDIDAEPEWVGSFAKNVRCHNPGLHHKIPDKNKPLIFTAVIEKPFVQWRNESQKIWPVRNDSLEGFLVDLLTNLRKIVRFKYKINLLKKGEYSLMIRELIEKKADAALAPITINAERQLKVDFTKPFYDFKISLIMKKPGDPEIDLFAFLLPFTSEVWLSMIGVVLFVTVAVFAIDYTSPFGYRALARETDEGSGDEFNLFNSLWFATGSMLGQGGDNTPRTPSGRILGAAFWFFILIMISTYTANLAAFFTISKSAATIESLEDLVGQDKIKYGVLRGGSVSQFFKNSKYDIHETMWRKMTDDNTFVNSTKDGVQKVREEDYAYLTEEPYLQYWNQKKPCNTRLQNNLLEPQSYGIALQQDSPYTKKFSVAILKLRESGVVEKLRKKWWDEKSECIKKAEKKTGSTTRLGLKNMAGVFFILFGGVLCALVLIIVEIKCKRVVDYLTKSQCTSENSEEPEPTENLRNIVPMVHQRPQNLPLRLPDLYANAPESKL